MHSRTLPQQPRPAFNQGFNRTELVVVLAALVFFVLIGVPFCQRVNEKSSRIKDTTNLKNIGLAMRIFATDHSDQFPQAMSPSDGGTIKFGNQAKLTYKHFAGLSNELSVPKILISPLPDPSPRIQATTWSEVITDLQQAHLIEFDGNEHISYAVGLDADETRPQSLLACNRGLTNAYRPSVFQARIVEMGRASGPWGWAGEASWDGQGSCALGDGSVQTMNASRFGNWIETMEGSNRISLPD